MRFNKIHLFVLLLLLIQATLMHAQPMPFNFEDESVDIVVNNRILAKVNNKAITVVDVMRKMDMIFYRQYPEYTSVKSARYQFYKMSWKSILKDLIDKELVLADAEENKLTVNSGEIRQEMEQLFGPNIIVNLDKAGLSYDEASKIVHDDAVIRRMLFFRVNSKVIKKVSPQIVRAAYEQKLKEHIPYTSWVYQVISVRSPSDETSTNVCNEIHKLLTSEKTPDQIPSLIQDLDPSIQVNVSNEFNHREDEVSLAYKEILQKIEKNQYSLPVAQKSRSDKALVYRIFFLKEKTTNEIPPFSTIAGELKEKITNENMDNETTLYLTKMRKHFGITNEQVALIPENFEPFTLRRS